MDSSQVYPGVENINEVVDLKPPSERDKYNETTSFDKFILILVSIIAIVTLPFSMLFILRSVNEYERGILFRLGKVEGHKTRGPGLFIVLPCIDDFIIIDLRTLASKIPPQDVITRDSCTISVDGVTFFRVFDAFKAVVRVADYKSATIQLSASTVRTLLSHKDLSEILIQRETLGIEVRDMLNQASGDWGISIIAVLLKDIRLPPELQRSMAVEAESARESRAKIIGAEGELQASAALKEASTLFSDNSTALKLRYLQTLTEIAPGRPLTILFPLPVDIPK